MSNFIDYFDSKYYDKLTNRANSFKKIFELLEEQQQRYYLIVETGCARINNNYSGDGMSTVLFDEFVNFYDGKVISIDVSEKSCKVARSLVSSKTEVICKDSVEFLWKLNTIQPIDLLYLDSFDISFKKPHPSMLHHMKEFCAAINKLRKGSIIAVDDNKGKIGKGGYINDFMQHIGYDKVIDDYQIAWIL